VTCGASRSIDPDAPGARKSRLTAIRRGYGYCNSQITWRAVRPLSRIRAARSRPT
jgi:hypothetical protein